MKRLVNERVEYRVNEGKWIDFSIWNRYRYLDDEQIAEKAFQTEELTFQETKEYIEEGYCNFGKIGKTTFTKREYIEFPSGSILDGDLRYYENKFKSATFRKTFLEVNRILTIKDLSDLLPAEQFCEYLKDRGITTYLK